MNSHESSHIFSHNLGIKSQHMCIVSGPIQIVVSSNNVSFLFLKMVIFLITKSYVIFVSVDNGS